MNPNMNGGVERKGEVEREEEEEMQEGILGQ
jgi:hypothetical protein